MENNNKHNQLKNKQVAMENQSMDAHLLSQKDIEYFKSIPTTLHVVYAKIENKVLVEKVNTSFLSEDEADQFAETLAVSCSGFTLNFWGYHQNQISVHYCIQDTDNSNIQHRITIFPKDNK